MQELISKLLDAVWLKNLVQYMSKRAVLAIKWNFERSLLLPLLALSSQAYADVNEIPASYEIRLEKLEKTLQTGYNVPAQISTGLFLRADVFYWTAREEGLEYSLQLNTPNFAADIQYSVKQPQFDWDFGYRTGIGYTFKAQKTDLGLYWTHFFTRAQDSGRVSGQLQLLPIWSHPNFINFPFLAANAEASWKLEYDQLDLTMGRAFYVSKSFILRPFLGPSLLRLNQHYSLKYETAIGIISTDHVKMKNEFEAVGLNAGCDLHFSFKHGWSILGKANLGVYYGDFTLKHKEKLFTFLNGLQYFKAKQNLAIGTLASTLGLGLAWGHGFSHNCYSLQLKLMWEEIIFFSQNQLFRFITPNAALVQSNYVTNQGDLTLQGGTFSATFGF